MTLTVHQPTLLSRDLEVFRGSQRVAAIAHHAFSPGATMDVRGVPYDARASWFGRSYSLWRGADEIASARLVSFWGRSYEIRAGTRSYEMRRPFFRLEWTLVSGNATVGHLKREGVFRCRTVAEFDDAIDLPVQVFLIWFANVIWRRDEAAAA